MFFQNLKVNQYQTRLIKPVKMRARKCNEGRQSVPKSPDEGIYDVLLITEVETKWWIGKQSHVIQFQLRDSWQLSVLYKLVSSKEFCSRTKSLGRHEGVSHLQSICCEFSQLKCVKFFQARLVLQCMRTENTQLTALTVKKKEQ